MASGAAGLATLAAGAVQFARWGGRWGATPEEQTAAMPGDAYLAEGPAKRTRIRMTRAISIAAPPETVLPWLAQLGRGAGYYSYDRLDNGGKRSAEHIVSWIPAPRLGDASPIGYLRHLDEGRELAWWTPGQPFLGSQTRMVFSIRLMPAGDGSRLVIRIVGDAAGWTAPLVIAVFADIDSVMARRQLLSIKDRAERFGARRTNPERPETGATDQYQFDGAMLTSGLHTGVAGKESGALWHEAAMAELGPRFGAAGAASMA
jgi:hypothetical protein